MSDTSHSFKLKLANKSEQEGFKYIYIDPDESKGGNFARNIGIVNSKGKYVAFLDDDDEWMPGKIEKQVEILEENNDYKVCHCGRINDYNFGENQIPSNVSLLPEGDLHTDILIEVRCVTSTMIVDRELLMDVGMFDENIQYWQEYDLCIRLLQKTKLAVIRENLVLYRIISSDDHRLTNKIDGWEDSVDQIYQKYADLMATLTKKQLKQRDLFHYHDGALRCHNSGDTVLQRQYLWKIYHLTHNPKDFLKAILNVYKIRI